MAALDNDSLAINRYQQEESYETQIADQQAATRGAVLDPKLAPTILASTTWYVNGASGRDSNNCKYPTTACKTIGHAISLASSGDTIRVAAATYIENITIRFSLTILGADPRATIIDGGGANTVVTINHSGARGSHEQGQHLDRLTEEFYSNAVLTQFSGVGR